MVGLIAFLEAAQNRDGALHRGFGHLHRLETPLQRRVLFDVLAVFIERGGPDTAQFTASQLGLEHVGRIGSTLGSTGPHDGVQLIDEEDDSSLGRGHFLEEGLETVLELAAIFRASDHRADIERNHPTVLEGLRHIAIHDPLGQSLDDGRLAHAGFTDEHRIVLRAPRQHLHHPTDFVVPADHRVDLALASQGCEVLAVLFQGLKLFLRVRIRHTLVAPHRAQRLENRIALESQPIRDATKAVAALFQQAQEQVLRGNILILEPLRLGQSRLESGLQVIGRINIGPALNGGTAHQLRFQFPHQSTHLHTGFFQQRRNDSVGLSHQSQSQMLTVESRMVMILGPGLGCLNGLLGLLGQFIECHCCPTASTMPDGADPGSKENRPEWSFCYHSGLETETNRVNPTQYTGQADAPLNYLAGP